MLYLFNAPLIKREGCCGFSTMHLNIDAQLTRLCSYSEFVTCQKYNKTTSPSPIDIW